ncbi:Dinitrogenase iron-molybdenum cofactor [Eubacterium ruminantium]|nr:Dinitrogenase iron-molybdenum cofactor [Eubacterium ruminantium]
MSVIAAVASDDGIKVNMHFGWARELLIYKVEDDGSYELIDEREVPELREERKSEQAAQRNTEAENSETGNGEIRSGGVDGTKNGTEYTGGLVKDFLERSGAGCGNGHSCGENFKHVNIDELIDSFTDCQYILALKIGRMMERIFRTKGISCFSVDLTIDEALKSIATYEQRKNRQNSKIQE